MKNDGVSCIEDAALFAGFGGPGVAPGDYKVRVSIEGEEQTVPVTLTMDPRINASEEEIEFWSARTKEVTGLLDEVLTSLDDLRRAQKQMEALMVDYSGDARLQWAGSEAIKRMTAWDTEINQVLHQTYEDEDAWETKLAGQLRFLLDVIDRTGAPVTEGALQRLADLKAEWQLRKSELEDIQSKHIAAINNWAREQGIPHVTTPEE